MTQTNNASLCLFTFFSGGQRASIDCINGTEPLTRISPTILNSSYFQNITEVFIAFQSSRSSLPNYLCSLPSGTIDLSNQSFTILNNQTFPCGSNSTLRTINWSFNQITRVDLFLSTWLSISFVGNNLTEFPYSLFDAVQDTLSSRQITTQQQRSLSLQSNRLSQFDIFFYTFAYTNIDMRNNPFTNSSNGYNSIVNTRNQSLTVETISTNIVFPSSARFLITDALAQDYNACRDGRILTHLIEILDRIRSSGVSVEVECQCASFYTKEYYKRYNASNVLTNRFRCSSRSTLNTLAFENLVETDCLSNLLVSQRALCSFARLQVNTSDIFIKPNQNELFVERRDHEPSLWGLRRITGYCLGFGSR